MKIFKIIKNILFLLGMILCSFTFAGENQMSISYSSLKDCNEDVIKYNIKYPKFHRNDCFKGDDDLYYYNICDNGDNCGINSSINNDNKTDVNLLINKSDNKNQYAQAFSNSTLIILEKIVSNLKSHKNKLSPENFNKLLKAFDGKLESIQKKYLNNTEINNIILYLQFESKQLYIDTSVDDFFCELTGNCNTITSSNTIDKNIGSKVKVFENPKINNINILSNFGGTTGITKFCIQNGYTRATSIKTSILPLSERQTNGLYWYAGPEKLMLYYDALKDEELNGQNAFEYAKNLDKYWNYVTSVSCINDNFVIIDDSKRINENECDSIIEYGNIKLCSTSKIVETYEEKDSICPTGYKVPNPIELAQVLYSSKSHFTLNSPFLKIFPKGAYWLAGKGKNGNVYLYANKIGGGGSKEIFGWIGVQRYLNQDKYVMCYKGPDISMVKYEMSTGFNFYLGGYPQGICNPVSTTYKGYTINNIDRTYLLNGEKAIFNTDDDNIKIVMTCNNGQLTTKTEEEFNIDEAERLKKEQEELEQQKIEEENKRLLEEEAKTLGCEKLIKFGDISFCDTGKSVAFNGLNTISCPTGYKKPNYREAMYFKIVSEEMKNAGFNPNYWTTSVVKDIGDGDPQLSDNRYLTSGARDMGAYQYRSGLIRYGRTLTKYNVLCYKGPNITNNYINNCNLKSFYNFGTDSFMNKNIRKKLLQGERIKIESKNGKKIEIICNGNQITEKPLNYSDEEINIIKIKNAGCDEIIEDNGYMICKRNSSLDDGGNIFTSRISNPANKYIYNNRDKKAYKIDGSVAYTSEGAKYACPQGFYIPEKSILSKTLKNDTEKTVGYYGNTGTKGEGCYLSSSVPEYGLGNACSVRCFIDINKVGQCGKKIDTCIKGTKINIDDTDTEYKWYCEGDTKNIKTLCSKKKFEVDSGLGSYRVDNIGENNYIISWNGGTIDSLSRNINCGAIGFGGNFRENGSTKINVSGYSPMFPLEIGYGCFRTGSGITPGIKYKLYDSSYTNTIEYDTEGYLKYNLQTGHINRNLKNNYGRNIKIEDLSGEKSLNGGMQIFSTRFQFGTISFNPKKSTTIKLTWDGNNGKKYEKFIYISIYK